MLGQTVSAGVLVDGSPVPSGTTLLSPSVLATRSDPGRIFLAEGHVLKLAPETRAYLAATPWGELELAVEDGAVAVHSGNSEPVTAVASQRLVFIRPEVQIAQLGGSSSSAALAVPQYSVGLFSKSIPARRAIPASISQTSELRQSTFSNEMPNGFRSSVSSN